MNLNRHHYSYQVGFPGGSVVKNLPANSGNEGDRVSIPGSGRSPGLENGKLLRYSCLENVMGWGTWWAPVQGVAELDTTEQLSVHTHTHAHNQQVAFWLVFERKELRRTFNAQGRTRGKARHESKRSAWETARGSLVVVLGSWKGEWTLGLKTAPLVCQPLSGCSERHKEKWDNIKMKETRPLLSKGIPIEERIHIALRHQQGFTHG